MALTIVWFRQDLRVWDHEPLHRAARRGRVIPIYIFERSLLQHPETCPAQVAFILSCLAALDQDLRHLGGRLIVQTGDPAQILPDLVARTQADGIYAHIDCDRLFCRIRDAQLNRALAQREMRIRYFEPPGSIEPLISYPEYRQCWHRDMGQAMAPRPAQVLVPDELTDTPLPTLAELEIIPDDKPIPAGGIHPARSLLQEFFDTKAERYYWQLSYPSAEATTGLSPYIKVGAISIRECVHYAQAFLSHSDLRIQRSSKQLISRLRWGSGFHQRFRYLPQLEICSLYQVFDQEGWDFDPEAYARWQQGTTGFPIVDAAARCLRATGGWKGLNFRSRAIYASFLSNLLGMDWRWGALHFMQHLLDGDCAIDHYQWAMQAGVTHCADKSWTRIYNPGEAAIARCDPEAQFIRQWLPELERVPLEHLGQDLSAFGYPAPMLHYAQSRKQRVQQLERQRGTFRQQEPITPHLSRMPEHPIPFAGGQHIWNVDINPELFPSAIDLDRLDLTQANQLRTWLVAHVDIKPHSPRGLGKKSRSAKASTKAVQLSLF
ncbi:MAG: deoxyribodipyrimidine photo-lyase [Oscillatoriales cyanobacterium SM2_2_1]|nr:deoxyribodipyrimidine photo-lyase [Oscillatoriales cyanobacterium SM2_2_1]